VRYRTVHAPSTSPLVTTFGDKRLAQVTRDPNPCRQHSTILPSILSQTFFPVIHPSLLLLSYHTIIHQLDFYPQYSCHTSHSSTRPVQPTSPLTVPGLPSRLRPVCPAYRIPTASPVCLDPLHPGYDSQNQPIYTPTPTTTTKPTTTRVSAACVSFVDSLLAQTSASRPIPRAIPSIPTFT
jgi:hypothetical protein